MTTTRRGITDHELLQTFVGVEIRLSKKPITRREVDRVAVVVSMMLASPLCTAAEAVEAADRLFPLPETGGEDDETVEGHS